MCACTSRRSRSQLAPAILLREGWRENGKVLKRTLANLSSWDPQLVAHFRVLLRAA